MIQLQNQRVLVLAPHEDDESIGCGGLIHMLVDNGSDVKIIFGSVLRHKYHKINNGSQSYQGYDGEDRTKESAEAMQILGVDPNESIALYEDDLDHRYQSRLDTVPIVEIIDRIEKVMIEYKPTMILYPAYSTNQDHRMLNKAVLSIGRPHFFRGTLVQYEVGTEIDFKPNLYIQLYPCILESVISAIACYETQHTTADDLFIYSTESNRIRRQYRGRQIGCRYAEAYEVTRMALLHDNEEDK